MAQHQDTSGLPITWPFRAAGTLAIIALGYFCIGFAAEDVEEHLWQHLNVFQVLLLVALILTVVGGIINASRARSRRKS